MPDNGDVYILVFAIFSRRRTKEARKKDEPQKSAAEKRNSVRVWVYHDYVVLEKEKKKIYMNLNSLVLLH